uniref:SRP54-type proteins GTP-binding domain-containing protein n=1 Tax=Arcella intermedia TaxID=1963864 RepID=A0A6B2KZZ6_9EUKA|eukprot:TRINITY_DN23997_c0_g1_i1.p1 TRINITY_DN23997_c0_g1~~TRINITY_DN23997_c0_g1_i1.p1  ORF type:complete len:609 (+),score=172.27 TRINITY_DN23997_c0_g1_i1:86-1912(+)
MLEHFCVFTLTGFVLWRYDGGMVLRGQPVNELIKTVILEERSGMTSFPYDNQYILKWTQANDLELIFVAVYQSVLRLPYIDEFLETVKDSFTAKYGDNLRVGKTYSFDKEFDNLLREVQVNSSREREQKKPASFKDSLKKEKLEQKGIVVQEKKTKDKKPEPPTESSPQSPESPAVASSTSSPPASPSQETLLSKSGRSLKVNGVRRPATTGSKKKPKNESPSEPAPGTKRPKQKTIWNDNPEGLKNFNFSDPPENTGTEKTTSPEELGIGEKVRIDEFSESESSETEEEEEDENPKAQKSGLLSFFTNIINKELTEKDLAPVLKQFSDHLISKNVAKDIAEGLCSSVSQSLVGKQLNTFSRVSQTVKEAMEAALTRILTPKRTIDVLRDARASSRKKVPYVIVFVGVNGVGKSTSLSKVCSWLLQNNLSVMMAACDTFRAGAIEQLEVHAKNLGVNVFHQGYGKDPAGVAAAAIAHAKRAGIDVVLIDTAGRMQDNKPLMTALAKLVGVNEPDLVLFVGEALVGNEAVDQLTKFNRSLEEFGTDKNPRGIDGIFLTKFDTVDEKVGAAISMAYTTGQPIVFVGVGQKYSDLKVLNVQRIVSVLLKGK